MNNVLIKTKANIMLFLAALIWGVAFVFQKTAMDTLDPFIFNALRFLLGSFVLFIITLFIKPKANVKYKRRHLIEGGAMAGSLVFLAATFQQIGIIDSTAGKAGFISSLYILMVPIFSVIAGKKISKIVWLGIATGILGLYFLCMDGVSAVQKGDLLVLFSAVFFALHIMCVAKYAKKTDSIKFSCVQFLFSGLFALMGSFIFEQTTLEMILKCKNELLFTGIFSCAIAFTLQISGQKHTKPHIASIIMSLESVFSVIAAFIFLHEILSGKQILGCLLMFIAVFLAQYHKKRRNIS